VGSSGSDAEPQHEVEDEEEVEEFKVDSSGKHQIKVRQRRLSDVVEEEK